MTSSERINARVQKPWWRRAEAEVRHLSIKLAQGQLLPSIKVATRNGIGPYLAGDITNREAVIAAIQQNSRRYASVN